MGLEGLGIMTKLNVIGNRTYDLPACSIAPLCYRAFPFTDPLQSSGSICVICFNILQLYILPTKCIRLFRMVLTIPTHFPWTKLSSWPLHRRRTASAVRYEHSVYICTGSLKKSYCVDSVTKTLKLKVYKLSIVQDVPLWHYDALWQFKTLYMSSE
jgi:hypothetical protein